MAKSGSRTCIVGGGMLGLSLAHGLSRAGHEVTVYEAAGHMGGLADPWELGNVVWDRHYHVTLLSDFHLRSLLRDLDLEEEIQWRTTRSLFYADERFHDMNNAVDFLRFPPIGLIDKIRLAATIVYASRITKGEKLERIPLTDWLVQWSGRRTFDKIWRPLLRAKLGDNYERASAAFIWAIIRRLYAARRSGLKTEMFGYVPGGYAVVLDRLCQSLRERGVSLNVATPVEKVERVNGQVRVSSNGSASDFDQVVITLVPRIAARLCPQLSESERRNMESVAYQGVICASMLLKRPLSDAYITYITDERIPFTAVIEMSALVDREQFSGYSLVYLPKYVDEGDPAFKRDDEDLKADFLAGLRKMYPDLADDEIAAFRMSKVRQVLPIPTVHYSDSLAPVETTVPGLSVVNSSHIVNGTLNVNETMMLAEETLGRLTGVSQGGR